VKDTEEYINIELDSSRNRLIRLEIVLTAGTFGVAIFSLVAGACAAQPLFPAARRPSFLLGAAPLPCLPCALTLLSLDEPACAASYTFLGMCLSVPQPVVFHLL
jgi:hypothetical protein